MALDNETRLLEAIRSVIGMVAAELDLDAHVRLWDGSRVPLGHDAKGPFEISIADPGVIASLVRKPSLDRLIQHYIAKRIDYSGGTLVDFGLQMYGPGRKSSLKGLPKLKVMAALAPFLKVSPDPTAHVGVFGGDETGRHRHIADNKAFIQFHYDLSNEFYALWLDPEMVYSCAYYTDWSNGVEQAQRDKLEMICRKLRLRPGDTLLDIGCGWGGLVCHAAKNYGVKGHGITLSEKQLVFAREKVKRLGLDHLVTLELSDYMDAKGRYDKIASIGMYEHIGLKNIPAYMFKVRSLLNDDGIFLNHSIASKAERPRWLPRRRRPEKKAIQKYIFPGGELDDIGHSLQAMEIAGFEVCDVEAWREHYARTCRLWCERLTARKDEAIAAIGEDKYRIWVTYLAGVSLSFTRGTLRIFQTVATKNAKGKSPLPPTRDDLYL